MKQKIVVIAGPTASGKTAVAVELCRRLGGEVVSADSMQIYRGMEILSAAPTQAEMRGIAHHMIGVAEPSEKYSAAKYRDAAKRIIAEIAARGKLPVLCGGTGLYIDAVTRPMDFAETCDEALRKELLAMAEAVGGRRRLHEMLEEIDPEAAAKLHENDVRRVTRAIEVYRLTGRTQREQMEEDRKRSGDYDETFFCLEWSREALYERIERRVDGMVKGGLIGEVARLKADANAHPTALQAIGYKEIAAALDGDLPMETAVEMVKRLSRNYAKKQMTWFRREPRAAWIAAEGRAPSEIADEMIERLEKES